MPSGPISRASVSVTALNFGPMMAACFFISSSVCALSLRYFTWRSWLILS